MANTHGLHRDTITLFVQWIYLYATNMFAQ